MCLCNEVLINEVETKIKLVTGAQLNVMQSKFHKLLGLKIIPRNVVIRSFGGYQIKSQGKDKVKHKNNTRQMVTVLKVVNYEGISIL